MATEDGGQLKMKTFILNSVLISAIFMPSCGYIGIPATISDSMPQWSSPRRILKYPEVTKENGADEANACTLCKIGWVTNCRQ